MAEATEATEATKGPGKVRELRPKRRSRHCDYCGKYYNRRNQIEVWATRNPGHRIGWGKEIVRICNGCFSPTQAQSVMLTAGIHIQALGPTKRRLRRASS